MDRYHPLVWILVIFAVVVISLLALRALEFI